MLTDRKVSELISKSLAGKLSEQELTEVADHLDDNPASGAFAALSQVIDESVTSLGDIERESAAESLPRLSGDAKQRMRRTIGEASVRLSQSADATIGREPTDQNGVSGEAGIADIDAMRETRSRFQLIRKLGEGGLGTVWLARDQWLKRVVAVKEMRLTALDSPKAKNRFLREAQITGHLEHPSIVPLYLFGEDPNTGRPFYAMRFAGKQTLDGAIIEFHERREAGVTEEIELHRLLQSFLRICQAIAYAHSRGVIHRDLKPENVALDNFGQVVVLDWGLAKVLDDGELGTKLSLQRSAELETVLTQTLDGEVVGTPLYMAPEQAAGELDNLDEKTDVYGLGAILFAILTGCAPHENSNTSQDGRVRVSDLLQSIAVADAPSPRDLNASVPADLAAICTKAMSRRRHGRHRSANELANEVEHWLAGQHEKQAQYDTLRMEGRELRATVDGTIRDIGRNTRFMANLPPIQGIIGARCGNSDETESVWRERLTTIFMGLLRANTDYSAVSYCQIVGSCDDGRDQADDKRNSSGRVKEVVRVERHSTDLGNLRSVPASRLADFELESWSKSVVDQQPEEVFTDLAGRPSGTNGPRVLAAGVPVFDDVSEEIFGYVRIECDLDSILDDQVRARANSASHVLVVDQADNVWSHHCREKGRLLTSCGRPMKDFVQCFQAVHTAIGDANEYLDDTNHDVYATKIELVPGVSWLTLILGNRHRRSP